MSFVNRKEAIEKIVNAIKSNLANHLTESGSARIFLLAEHAAGMGKTRLGRRVFVEGTRFGSDFFEDAEYVYLDGSVHSFDAPETAELFLKQHIWSNFFESNFPVHDPFNSNLTLAGLVSASTVS